MQRLQDSISDYRELNEPLQRSMRAWWHGAGRNWLIALAALGFLGVVCLAILGNIDQVATPGLAARLWFAAQALSQLLVLCAVLACHMTGLMRRRLFFQLNDEAVIPDSGKLRKVFFMGGLLANWPIALGFLLIQFLQGFLLQLASLARAGGVTPAFNPVVSSLDMTMLVAFYACLSIAFLNTGQRRSGGFLFLAIVMLGWLVFPLYYVLQSGLALNRVDFDSGTSHLLVGSGTLTALGLLASGFLYRSDSRRAMFAVLTLGLLRLLEQLADFTADPASVFAARNISLLEFLRGFQIVFEQMPFSYGMHTFEFVDHAEGAMALQLFWNQGLAIRLGGIGYLLVILLNLAWLVGVFLFCRWAVGRSAGRSQE